MGNGNCVNCFAPLSGDPVCGQCGFDNAAYVPQPHHLPPGTVLRDRYIIGRAMGQGGFGITYVGFDLNMNRRVAIKEFYPNGIAWRDAAQTDFVTCTGTGNVAENFRQGVNKCVKEAQSLAQLDDIPGVVRGLDQFQANNTAYIIMEFVEGVTLRDYLRQLPQNPDFRQAVDLLFPIGKTLQKVHERGYVHRDVSPDNIMINREGALKLLDFGAVKMVVSDDGGKTEHPIIKRGFSPMEMYSTEGKIGPWSDVYAYCATVYYMLIGDSADEPSNRSYRETLGEHLANVVSPAQCSVLEKGMALQPQQRYQKMSELLDALSACRNGHRSDPGPEKPKKKDPGFSQWTTIEGEDPQQKDNHGSPNIKKWLPAFIAAAVVLCVAIGIAANWLTKTFFSPTSTSEYSGTDTSLTNVASSDKDTPLTTEAPSDTAAPSTMPPTQLAAESTNAASSDKNITLTTEAPLITTAPTTLPQQPSVQEQPTVPVDPVTEKLNSAHVGDYVEFGAYEQDNDASDGRENIEWLVLAKENGKALLISRYGLDQQPYNTGAVSVTWETCTLRTWLNGTFYDSAFSGAEQERIASTVVTADKNPDYDTDPGNDTTDKIFLLSINEASLYFRSDSDRMCVPTAYAVAQGTHESAKNKVGGKSCCWWWLRLPGDSSSKAVYVRDVGIVLSSGDQIHLTDNAVRPALWIDLNA